MSEAPHFSRHDALIPASPHFMRDWIPYLKALLQDQQCRAKAATIVAEKSGYPRKSLLRTFEEYVPAALKGNLKCVLAPQNERLVIAVCEPNALADQPLIFQAVKECIELGGPPECAPANCCAIF